MDLCVSPDGSGICCLRGGRHPTWMGDYVVAFLSAGVLCLLAAALVVRLPSSRPEPLLTLIPQSTEASIV
jgi:hypothetical protein